MTNSLPLSQVAAYLDQLLRVSQETDREGNGLAVAALSNVRMLGAAVNTSFEAINCAAELGVDLLLVHHAPWKEIDLDLRERKLALLQECGISLYAAHEALDRTPGHGSSDALARLLGLTVEGRGMNEGGVIGVFADGSFAELVRRTEGVLGVPVEAFRNSQHFSRGAIVTGAGGYTGYLREAQQLGCDTYLTGEGSLFTRLFAHEVGINLGLAGHYQTELPGIQALARHVAEKLGLTWVTVPESSGIVSSGVASW